MLKCYVAGILKLAKLGSSWNINPFCRGLPIICHCTNSARDVWTIILCEYHREGIQLISPPPKQTWHKERVGFISC